MRNEEPVETITVTIQYPESILGEKVRHVQLSWLIELLGIWEHHQRMIFLLDQLKKSRVLTLEAQRKYGFNRTKIKEEDDEHSE